MESLRSPWPFMENHTIINAVLQSYSDQGQIGLTEGPGSSCINIMKDHGEQGQWQNLR